MKYRVRQNKIHVCMVTGNYFPEISGGTVQCRTLVNALKTEVDFSVIATTIKYFSLTSKSLVCNDIVDDIQIYRIAITQDKTFLKINSILQIILLFLKHRKNFQILHMHGFTNKGILFIILAKLFKKNVLTKISLLGTDDPYTIKKNSRFCRLKYYFYSFSDLVVSPSPCLTERSKLAKLPHNKLVEIPNGVDTSLFRPPVDSYEQRLLRKELKLPIDKKIVLFVGFFSKVKGVDLLLEVWKKNKAEWKDRVVIVIIGSRNIKIFGVDDNLVKWVDRQIKLYAMEDEIYFIEETHCIEKYYRASDIFVFLSKREGLPNALLEAMASALPCLVTRLEGITDYVIEDGKDGIVVERRNVELLSSGLNKLLKDKELSLRLGQSARKTAFERFSIDKVAQRYLTVYRDLLTQD